MDAQQTRSARPARWWDVLLVALAWGAASALPLLGFNLSDAQVGIGLIGWLLTFLALRRTISPRLGFQHSVVLILAWLLLGFLFFNGPMWPLLNSINRLTLIFGLGGAVGGLIVGLALRRETDHFYIWGVALTSLAWAVALGLFPTLYLSGGEIAGCFLVPAGVTSGAIGMGATVWLANHAIYESQLASASRRAVRLGADGELISDGLAKPKRKPKQTASSWGLYARVGAVATAVSVVAVLLSTQLIQPREVVVYLTGPAPQATWNLNQPTPTALFNGYFRDPNYTVMIVTDLAAHLCDNYRQAMPTALNAGSLVRVTNASFSLTASRYTYSVQSLDGQSCADALTEQLAAASTPIFTSEPKLTATDTPRPTETPGLVPTIGPTAQ